MSQSEDLSAIHEYIQRTPTRTPAALAAKLAWDNWFAGLGTIAKNFDGAVLAEAISRRTAFNASNQTPENPLTGEGSLTAAEKEFFINYPTVDVTGMTAAEAQKAAWTKTDMSTTTIPATKPTIRQGSTGNAVVEWQAILGVAPDGKFGPATAAATKKWQTAHGLKADGVVGQATWSKAYGAAPVVITPVVPVAALKVANTGTYIDMKGKLVTPSTPTDSSGNAISLAPAISVLSPATVGAASNLGKGIALGLGALAGIVGIGYLISGKKSTF